jgi:hypothetical protein
MSNLQAAIHYDGREQVVFAGVSLAGRVHPLWEAIR